MTLMQSLIDLVYPPHCPACNSAIAEAQGICAECWRDTTFLSGLVCDLCGAPLPGEADEAVHCDACRRLARPWDKGRAALAYRDTGRSMVLGLKHGDKTDLARPAALWMYRAGRDLLSPDRLIVPIPLHRLRLLQRRYNQAALLAQEMAALSSLPICVDLLQRVKSTPPQKGHTLDQRFGNMVDALRISPQRRALVQDRDILLVDDVMTSGATLAAAAELCCASGARTIHVVTLARALLDD